MFIDEYQTIEARADASIEDRGSRFVGIVTPVASAEKAKQLVDTLSQEHTSMLDVATAYRIGLEPECVAVAHGHFGADESLRSILESKDLTYALIVVFREAGDEDVLEPSAQAYRDAALNALRRAKIVKRILYDTLRFEVERNDLEYASRFISDQRGKIIETVNGEKVIVSVKIRKVQSEDLKKALAQAFHGRVTSLD